MAGNFTEIDHTKKRKFLNAYAECGNIRGAEVSAGVSRQSHYHWIKDDPEYAAAFLQAREMAIDALEGIAFDRAQEKSDLLTIFLLKGNRRTLYGDRQDITSGGLPLGITVANTDAI